MPNKMQKPDNHGGLLRKMETWMRTKLRNTKIGKLIVPAIVPGEFLVSSYLVEFPAD